MEQDKSNDLLLKLAFFLTIVLFIFGGLLCYQIFQIKDEIEGLKSEVVKLAAIPVPTANTNLRIFRSSSQGFELSLPPNWYPHEAGQLRDVWISYPVDNPSIQNDQTNGEVVANIFTSTYTPEKSLQEELVLRSTIGGNQNQKQLYGPEKAEIILVGGSSGLFVVSDDQKYVMAMVDHGGKRYVFTLGTTDTSLISVFKEIILSLKFV